MKYSITLIIGLSFFLIQLLIHASLSSFLLIYTLIAFGWICYECWFIEKYVFELQTYNNTLKELVDIKERKLEKSNKEIKQLVIENRHLRKQ